MMKLKVLGFAAAGFLAATAVSNAAQAAILIIDDFENGDVSHGTGIVNDPTAGFGINPNPPQIPFPITDLPGVNVGTDVVDGAAFGETGAEPDDFGTTADATNGVANVIGGSRDTSGWVQEVYGSSTLGIDVAVSGGLYNFGQNPGHFGHGWIQYDGDGGGADPAWDLTLPADLGLFDSGTGVQLQDFSFAPTDANNEIFFKNVNDGLSGVNLTGFSGLEVDVVTADQDDTALIFRIYGSDGLFDADTYVAVATLIPDTAGLTTFSLPFAGATLVDGIGGLSIDDIFSDVGAIVFHTHTLDADSNHADLDLRLDEIRVVMPLPATLALFGFGLAAVGAVVRRKRA